MYELTKELPTAYCYGKTKLRLNMAFDVVLRVFDAMHEDDFSEGDKVEVSLRLLVRNYRAIGKLPIGTQTIILKSIFEEFIQPSKKNSKSTVKLYDFAKDAPYIYASFLQAYGIDLCEQRGKLHWWKFIAMFLSLPKDTKMSEIQVIRQRKIPAPNKHNQEEIRALQEAKRYYALDDDEADFDTALGNLFDLLEKNAKQGGDDHGRRQS